MPSLRKFALVAAAVVVGATLAADTTGTVEAAKKAPATIQIRYDVSRAWDVPAAVKAANVGPVKVVRASASNLGDCGSNCIIVFSDPYVTHTDCNGMSPRTAAAIKANERRLIVTCASNNVGSIQLGDTVAKNWTAAQRQSALANGLKAAIRR